MPSTTRHPVINTFYGQYLIDRDKDRYRRQVVRRYSIGTVERLALCGQRMTRRAAVAAIGLSGDFTSNEALGRALHDDDRGVRTLAEDGIRCLWCRSGETGHRRQLARVIKLNGAKNFGEAIRLASSLIADMPELAEAWNQRAIAHYSSGNIGLSIADCQQALELNPYHFGAATGLGQCYLELSDRPAALDSFRHALRLNPSLEGVRAHVVYLQRGLHRHE